MPPRISLIIPVYKAQDYIKRALDSCLHQTFTDIEIIVIDDCGGDNSLAIAKEMASRDSRIKIIQNPQNLGTFHARSRGIAEAKGVYCMFVDPDDFLALNACEIAYKTIKHTQADCVHFGMCYYPKTYKRIKPIVHKGGLFGENMRSFLSAGNNTQSLCDKIYKTSLLSETLKTLEYITPPLSMLEDGLLVLVVSLHSHSYFGIQDELYYYCTNPHSITKDKSVARLSQKQGYIDKLLYITAHLCTLYPAHTDLLVKYRHKIASTLLVESRDFSSFELYSSMLILQKHGFRANFDIPPYLKSTLLSLRYAFRWQNCVRGLVFVCTFGLCRL